MPIERPAYLLIYLLGMILFNVGLGFAFATEGGPGRLPEWVRWIYVALAASNVAWAVALLQWKKFGFWGHCVTSAFGFSLDVVYGPVLEMGPSLGAGLCSVLILYAMLRGRDWRCWNQLD